MSSIVFTMQPPTGSGVQQVWRERIRVHGAPESGGVRREYRVWWEDSIDLLTPDRDAAAARYAALLRERA